MQRDKMQYVIFAGQSEKEQVMLAGPVEDGDRDYFVSRILPTFQPLSDEQYLQGLESIRYTAARFSYILYQGQVYWSVEWDPGLIVVRFSPQGTMAWTALRSPIPNFGGRIPDKEDLLVYVAGAAEYLENHQYNLVFKAWDAQFEEDYRRWYAFERADEETATAYEAALEHVRSLGEQIKARFSSDEEIYRWTDQCTRNLKEWTREGIRAP